MSEVLVEVWRGGRIESLHRGSVAVVDVSGNLLAWSGEPETFTFMRSAAKPIQALAVVESGACEAFGLSERELAVMCASHSSEPYHVEVVLGILAKLGLAEEHLQCGTHWPSHQPSAFELARRGRRPSSVHCNCSGKHSGMLAVSLHLGWPLDGYWQTDHPVQRLCLENTAAVAGYPASKIELAVDGCGVPVVALPIRHMAQAFARLANPAEPGSGFSPERVRSATTVTRAMRAHPEMVGGTGRLCTALMRHTPVVAKSGAEGVYCAGLPGKGVGLAVKIDDGHSRAVGPVVTELLRSLDVLTADAASALQELAHPLGLNHRGEKTGDIRAAFQLTPAG